MTRQPLAGALRLVVILDTGVAREAKADLEALARSAARGGATMLQVRAKREPAGDVADLTHRIIAAAPGLPVIVNDRLDVAIAAGAAGCHLGQDDFPIADAVRLAPPGFWLGGSGGTAEEARRAAAAGAHYLGIGPIAATGSKADAGVAIGIEGFRAIHAAAPGIPAVAIGGVTAELVPGLLAAGAAGVAVIRAVVGAADPAAATRVLRAALDA
ncbi:MAG TPA: thiamine phosphate synthase [Gemmatimonadales bacterium]|nr:thiamine phosphate synthase [Gemmatimonadales bacterium]